jgi:hypothetical protein
VRIFKRVEGTSKDAVSRISTHASAGHHLAGPVPKQLEPRVLFISTVET